MHFDACFFGRIVVHLAHFDLTFLYRAHDGFDDLGGGSAEWNLGDDECLVVVRLLDLGTDTHSSTSLAIVVSADINLATCGEIGVQHKLFAAQIGQGCIADLAEVMR